MAKHAIFIDGTAIATTRMSGVGHVLLETLRALDCKSTAREFKIVIFIPWNEKKNITHLSFHYIKIRRLPIPHKLLSLSARLPITLPLDFFLGKGTYIFPNFRNWSVAFSQSITYVHDVCFALHPEFVEPRNRKFLQKYIQYWLKRTDIVIAVSETTKNELLATCEMSDDRIVVIKNAVDSTTYFPQSPERIAEVKSHYGLGDYIVFVGNIEPRKNLETLIRAFEKTKPSTGSLFLIGGDGWLNQTIYEAIDHANLQGDRVQKNKTFVPDGDLPALISGARALVQPSWHEGFGLPVVEAMACGTPVICSDIPGLREITTRSHQNVAFFQPSDEKKLTQLLDRALAHKQRNKPFVERTWRDASDELLTLIRGM